MKSRWDAGQFKLNGKKHKHLSCGCCTIENFKQECRQKEMAKEISDYIKESENVTMQTMSNDPCVPKDPMAQQ